MVRDGRLLFYAEEQAASASIVVGSEQWFAWLCEETSTIFSFHAPGGSYTARKERAGSRRGGWYWKAYHTYQGKLYRAYLGKSEDLTLTQLYEVALTLAKRVHDWRQEGAEVAAISLKQPQRDMPLLATKLHSPRLPSLLVPRERLLALLGSRRSAGSDLLLRSAPVGVGSVLGRRQRFPVVFGRDLVSSAIRSSPIPGSASRGLGRSRRPALRAASLCAER